MHDRNISATELKERVDSRTKSSLEERAKALSAVQESADKANDGTLFDGPN